MADISSLYPQAPPNQTIFGTINALQDTQAKAQQNQLTQQELQSRQAIGEAYAKNTDPTTGEVNQNAFVGQASHDPRSAFMTGELNANALAQTHASIENQRANLVKAHEVEWLDYF